MAQYAYNTLWISWNMLSKRLCCLCFLAIGLAYAYPMGAQAGAYPIPEGEVKLFAEFAWSRSNGIFGNQDNPINLSRTICADADSVKLDYCGHTYDKLESKLFVEYGARRYMTLIGEIAGGRQRSFQDHAARDWLEMSAGFRLTPFQRRRIVISIENSYGYAYQSQPVNITQSAAMHDGFVKIALQIGTDWRLHKHIRNYLSTSYGWKHSLNNAVEENYFFTTATLGIEFADAWLRYDMIILNDAWVRADQSGARRYRSIAYNYQISAVVFPTDQFGIQLGYRTVVGGRNVEMSDGVFTKLWLIF